MLDLLLTMSFRLSNIKSCNNYSPNQKNERTPRSFFLILNKFQHHFDFLLSIFYFIYQLVPPLPLHPPLNDEPHPSDHPQPPHQNDPLPNDHLDLHQPLPNQVRRSHRISAHEEFPLLPPLVN